MSHPTHSQKARTRGASGGSARVRGATSRFNSLPCPYGVPEPTLPQFALKGLSVHPYWLVRSHIFQPEISIAGDCIDLPLFYRIQVKVCQVCKFGGGHGTGRRPGSVSLFHGADQWTHTDDTAISWQFDPFASAGHYVGQGRRNVWRVVHNRGRNHAQDRNDDPPDIATFLAHVMTGRGKGVKLPADSRIVRMSPLIRPVKKRNGTWSAPGSMTAAEFAYLANLDLDAIEQRQVDAISSYADLWLKNVAPNQPIRMDGKTFKCELGQSTFRNAVRAWKAIKT